MLYYTGSIQPNAVQNTPSKSLGGYISSSAVSNDLINNLFSNIDYTTITKNLKNNRVIAFLNTTGSVIDKFTLYVNSNQNNVSKLKFGLARSSIDESCNAQYFETLQNENASPFYVELKEAEGQQNALEIENIPPGSYIGIFIQRELIADKNPEMNPDTRNSTCDDMYMEHESNPDGSSKGEIIDEFEIIMNTDDIETNLIVDAGGDVEKQLPTQSVTLIGDVESDYPVKGIKWSIVKAPNKPKLINDTSVALTLVDLVAGEYVLELSATDFFGNTKSDTVNLDIIPEELKVYFGFANNRVILNEDEILKSTNFIIVNKGSDYDIHWPDSKEVYYWFAESISEPVKTKWEDIAQPINKGNIGTDNDLFPDPIEIGSFRYYITVYKTQMGNSIIRFKK